MGCPCWMKVSVCSLLEPEPAQPMQKRCRVEAQAGLNPAQAPVEVLVDLCVKENTLDETLSYLLKKAKKRGLEKPQRYSSAPAQEGTLVWTPITHSQGRFA